MNCFKGDTADQVWRQTAKALFSAEDNIQNSRLGRTIELLHVGFEIESPRDRWVYSRQPSINPAYAIADIFWILGGRNDAEFVNHWHPRLPNFSGKTDQYYGAYGYRIRKQFGFDQLQRAYDVLKNNIDSRQVVLQIWDPKKDMPDSAGRPASLDIPCNICSILKVRKSRLEWLQVMRSNDVFRGMPYNIIQFTTLQEILSGWLGIEMGSYNHISDSLHCYENDTPVFHVASDNNFLGNTESLALPKDESDVVIDELSNILDKLTQPTIAKQKIMMLCRGENLPDSYRNLLVIAAADSVRRRGWDEEDIEQLVTYCTNPALSLVWENWYQRFRIGLNRTKPV